VDAYGEVDELNACLGAARATCEDPDLQGALVDIQQQLFAVGARLADPSTKIAARVDKAAVRDEDVERLEQLIDRLEMELPPCADSSSPGWAHRVAGSRGQDVCRRAERRVVGLGDHEVESIVVI
jgi:cob(I)alamin adenosyltransferase